jgi:hypothetical protein
MIEVDTIQYFTSPNNKIRSKNDTNNKYREEILKNINNIDKSFYDDEKYGNDWINLIFNFNKIIKTIAPPLYKSFNIIHKAGRSHNYDYIIQFLDETQNVLGEQKLEFKYNAETISDTPQFVSPMFPSQYLSNSFEEYFYDNYIHLLCEPNHLPIPEKEIYVKTIHNNKPKCMEEAQLLYYQGCKQSSKYTNESKAIEFYNICNEYSRECIKQFIHTTDLYINKLNDYLQKSQEEKTYLLYKNGGFRIQKQSKDDYTIIEYKKNPEKYRYEAITKSNKKINILLRWKNGNGIAYPAFQIS